MWGGALGSFPDLWGWVWRHGRCEVGGLKCKGTGALGVFQ